MAKNDNLGLVLKNFIQETERAIEEGWIHSEYYQKILRIAKKSLPNYKEAEFKYPDSGGGFHVIQQK